MHNCSPEAFVNEVFSRCLHRRARLFAQLILAFKPQFFKEDFWLVEQAAHAHSRTELGSAIISFHEDCRLRAGFLHDRLHFRISGRRLLRLFAKTMAATTPPSDPNR